MKRLGIKRFKGISHFGMSALCVALVSCSQLPLMGQSLPSERRLGGKLVEAAFENQRLVLQDSSAVIYEGRIPIGYGAVMSADGYILTKSSELYNFDEKTRKSTPKDIMIIVGEERYSEVTLVAENTEWDLALLKIDALDLKPIKWAESSEVGQGSWVVANGSSSRWNRRVNIGIISAKPRKIDGALPVIMGVGLKKVDAGVEITGVSKNSGAEEAGFKKGDIITKFDGKEVEKREDIIDVIREKAPGDKVPVEFTRDGKALKHDMLLKDRKEVTGDNGRKPKSRNDQMSGEFSSRRDSFPRVLQTDILHNFRQTGGPLLLMNGEAIGIIIARANRAESFAVPVEEALEVYKKLKAKAQ